MFSIACSWIVIFLLSFLYGKTLISAVYGNKPDVMHRVDVYVVCGLMFINFYAQIFSLFHRVGQMAFIILAAGAAGCTVYLRSRGDHGGGKPDFYPVRGKMAMVAVSVAATLFWTNLVPQHYDTYLYHAQAIRWIEEYGIVPGLGNFHFRLAYNSAFMALQALFSFKWLLGSSLHTVNGFIAVFFWVYVLTHLKTGEKDVFCTSNLLRLAVIFYLIVSCYNISSPNTDMWPMLLLLYICMKWSEFAEQGVDDPMPYAFLCVLGVYAATLKLSVATFLILTFYPAALLIRKKNWRGIIGHLAGGMLIAMPYLVRNVIISGYLIYPYPELDLFHFDWKMQERVLRSDRREIMAWGRGIKDPKRYGAVFSEWFPEWFQSIHVLWKVLLIITLAAGVTAVFYLLREIKKYGFNQWSVLIVTCIGGLFYWLFTAPLPRYGAVYMLMIPCIVIPKLITDSGGNCFAEKWAVITVKYAVFASLCFYTVFFWFYSTRYDAGGLAPSIQEGYADRRVKKINAEGIDFYVPWEGDQTGYEPFPSSLGALAGLQLRGETLAEGFAPEN